MDDLDEGKIFQPDFSTRIDLNERKDTLAKLFVGKNGIGCRSSRFMKKRATVTPYKSFFSSPRSSLLLLQDIQYINGYPLTRGGGGGNLLRIEQVYPSNRRQAIRLGAVVHP